MAGYWLKLYTEILDDPKYYRLSDNGKLGMYELMIIAKKFDQDGELPDIEDICFYSRRQKEWWEPVLQELKKIQFIVYLNDCQIIRKFSDRQSAVPDADRQRYSRNNRHAKEFNNEETVTNASRNVMESRSRLREEKETEKEVEEEQPSSPVVPVSQDDWKSEYALNKEQYMSFEKDITVLLDNIFLGVTAFYPTKDAPETRRAIALICEKNSIAVEGKNSEKIKDVLRPYFQAWCKRKTANGHPYSKTNITWLTEWAVLGEIPPKNEPKKDKKTVADISPVQTREETLAIANLLRKSNKVEEEVTV